MVSGLYLSEDEIDEFIRDLDKNDTGYIDYDLLESKLDEAHEELASDLKAFQSRDYDQRHAFLRSVMGTGETRIPRQDFSNTVRDWNVPSLINPETQAEAYHEHYMESLPWSRRFWAYWSVQGREVLFIALVVSMQVAFGVWQLVDYLTKPQFRHVSRPRRFLPDTAHFLSGLRMGTYLFQSLCRSLVSHFTLPHKLSLIQN